MTYIASACSPWWQMVSPWTYSTRLAQSASCRYSAAPKPVDTTRGAHYATVRDPRAIAVCDMQRCHSMFWGVCRTFYGPLAANRSMARSVEASSASRLASSSR